MKSRRLVRDYRQELVGEKETIFGLLCPVREKEWLVGWDYKMIFSESGLAEKACIFETDNDFGSYQWVMTRYDRSNYIIQFVKFIQGNSIVIIDIELSDATADMVYCDIKYTFTAIDELLIEDMHRENSKETFDSHMKLWQDSMNHFLKTAQMLV